MANFTGLNETVSGLFVVINTLITEVTNLMTGKLLVLFIVGALVALIGGIITSLIVYIKRQMNSSITMKQK